MSEPANPIPQATSTTRPRRRLWLLAAIVGLAIVVLIVLLSDQILYVQEVVSIPAGSSAPVTTAGEFIGQVELILSGGDATHDAFYRFEAGAAGDSPAPQLNRDGLAIDGAPAVDYISTADQGARIAPEFTSNHRYHVFYDVPCCAHYPLTFQLAEPLSDSPLEITVRQCRYC